MRRPLLLLAAAFVAALGLLPASAGAEAPDRPDTARLLGYLWADGSHSDGVWDATAPDGARWLIEDLVVAHGGTWVDRSELRFRLPAPFDWEDWQDSLPNDDAATRAAVRDPHFLAALLEGEGEVGGVVYDQDTCCTAGFTRGRMVELVALLEDRGYESAELIQTHNADSGEVAISGDDIRELRAQLVFVCPSANDRVRIPGGTDWNGFGPLRWLGDGTPWSGRVRGDCPTGAAIPPPTAPTGECSVVADRSGNATIRWTYQRGRVVVFRDGFEAATPSVVAAAWRDRPNPGTHTWSLRVSADGRTATSDCGNALVQIVEPLATCRGRTVTILGTEGDDVLVGTEGDDVIDGLGGDDTIEGLGGDDVICAGTGSDRVDGGPGRDVVSAGRGWDTVRGGTGRDRISGGAGNDTLIGEAGNDRLIGDAGDDLLVGGGGRDRLYGRAGDDRLEAGRDRDICVGGRGTNSGARSCESFDG